MIAVAVFLFFPSNAKLKRYVAYAFGGITLVALVILRLTIETGTKSNTISGSEKAVVENVVPIEQSK
ncbi:hypothetical protein [Paenibacillus sp. UASWS1643]|uniref:hypothetical protein n=1 Tax=Paenibacillus sp. UASWS1643 TaxID=2580422 RepID=UPI00123C12E5|nr:hypothetical protein [Paenibacillus sp. UASWS1643]KAA8745369.1 hypothetical protein FE296_26115 [Paenibacillus sp. UASWS1643]